MVRVLEQVIECIDPRTPSLLCSALVLAVEDLGEHLQVRDEETDAREPNRVRRHEGTRPVDDVGGVLTSSRYHAKRGAFSQPNLCPVGRFYETY